MKGSLSMPPANQPVVIRVFAQVVSYLVHPLFVPSYVTAFLLYWHPSAAVGLDDGQKIRLLATVSLNLALFPFFTVFLLWRLRFIENMYLQQQKQRIIPYAAAMIFYFWGWYVLKTLANVPDVLKHFLLGSFLAVVASWMLNIFFKISMHAIAMGGMVMFCLLFSLNFPDASAVYLSAAFLLAGLVLTARFLVSDHTSKEIYSGFAVGMICQLLAWVL